ncbi:SAM-dependent methyltransferase [Streptomyces tateyamensis]|uniref:SAM-dependent methyltransferase n=1 Tax=Streptomyces tateyamensis TaxID=565073 RepID=A0A2V4NVM0_9ACTN|nr:methyltransferase domain-containing protein [Streptomyces tateyamensis]PYC80880.1 SAM-dependent methyltransferase [Streptomyces tateyamensis]
MTDARDHADHADHARTREFFAARAGEWERRFPEDGPKFAAAVAELGLLPGQSVLDAGCGTGRALPVLRQAVGAEGVVLGVDLTPEMLREAVSAGRAAVATLLLGDCGQLPLRTGAVDAVLGAGLLSHLRHPAADLGELARVTRPGGRLALFLPTGRAALAARHGRTLAPTDLAARPRLTATLTSAGWSLEQYLDESDRFLAVARRTTS